MKVIGKMIFNMDMELKLGLMDQNMKATTKTGRNMERAHIHGQMVPDMLGIGLITKLMVREFIPG